MASAIWGFIGTIVGAFIAMYSQYILNKRQETMQLKLAVLELRFKAHQGAYELCDKLRASLHEKSIQKRNQASGELSEWWLKNSLYLCPQSRQRLSELHCAFDTYDPDAHDNAQMERFVQSFKNTIKSLTCEMQLPPVSTDSRFEVE